MSFMQRADQSHHLAVHFSITQFDRFLHLKLLLHRRSLTNIIAGAGAGAGSNAPVHSETGYSSRSANLSVKSELSHSLRTSRAVVCVKAACELIKSLKRAFTEDATGAWWYSLFCKFSSASHAWIKLTQGNRSGNMRPYLDPCGMHVFTQMAGGPTPSRRSLGKLPFCLGAD
jgi:hypothetical protein